MSSEVPKEIIKKRRPEFGKRSDLQITTKLEDDITIPWRVGANVLSLIDVDVDSPHVLMG